MVIISAFMQKVQVKSQSIMGLPSKKMKICIFLICSILLVTCNSDEPEPNPRIRKHLLNFTFKPIFRNFHTVNFFTVVRFPNNACSGSNGFNGTCYSVEECETRGGGTAGDCAGGYGVCCTCE